MIDDSPFEVIWWQGLVKRQQSNRTHPASLPRCRGAFRCLQAQDALRCRLEPVQTATLAWRVTCPTCRSRTVNWELTGFRVELLGIGSLSRLESPSRTRIGPFLSTWEFHLEPRKNIDKFWHLLVLAHSPPFTTFLIPNKARLVTGFFLHCWR